jgi:hypothetical protein
MNNKQIINELSNVSFLRDQAVRNKLRNDTVDELVKRFDDSLSEISGYVEQMRKNNESLKVSDSKNENI